MRTLNRAALAALALALPGGLGAQAANPLPQAVGMAGNYTALARGLAAPAWNPAGLGMPDNPAGSFTLLPFNFRTGIGPVALSDFSEYDGQLIPREQRIEWLDLITENGGETGTFGSDVTFMALSIGHFALSATNSIRTRVNMAPDVAEVFFFGNAGLTGDPRDYSLAGSDFDVTGTTTIAMSVASPFSLTLGPLPDQHFALGATVKYIIGNFLMLGQENNSSLSSSPLAIDVQFPMVHTPLPDSTQDYTFGDIMNNGTGIGVDVGAAWQGGPFSAALVVKNLVNTFEWDTEALLYRQGSTTWNADTTFTDFESRDIADAPPELTERIDSLYTFSPVVAAGAAMKVSPFLTVTGEVRHALEENLDVGVRNHLGVGAKLTLIPIIPLRAGAALVSGGYELSGGLGLLLGPMELSAAGAVRKTELGDAAVGAFGLTFGIR